MTEQETNKIKLILGETEVKLNLNNCRTPPVKNNEKKNHNTLV